MSQKTVLSNGIHCFVVMLRVKSDKAFLYFTEILRDKLAYVPMMINKINPFVSKKLLIKIVSTNQSRYKNKGIQSFRSKE